MPSKNLAKSNLQLIRLNASLVKKLYPNINRAQIQTLKALTKQFSFSFPTGDVILLNNGWFVTHTGLHSPGTSQEMSRYPCRGRRFAV